MSKLSYIMLILVLSLMNKAYALVVGVTAGPHAIIMEEVKKEAIKINLDIKIVEFNDFILPNAALTSGEIDVNSYQHQPFLDEQIKDRGYKIISLAKTIFLPLGIYSLKYKTLNEIKNGAKISIPNDPANEGRALLLLEKANLIKLKSSKHLNILDITTNYKKINIITMEAPQITRTLLDVDYGITNTDWILLANIDPKSALLTEDRNSIYANVIAVREKDKSRNDIKQLITIYHSDYIKNFIIRQFQGTVQPAW